MTAPRVGCEAGQCSNPAFGKVGGLWLCDDCRIKRIEEYEARLNGDLQIIRSNDAVLECPAGHIFWEKFDLPMAMVAYVERLKGMLRCPRCGIKPRRGAKGGGTKLLLGDHRREAIQNTEGWTEVI